MDLYSELCSYENLELAYKKARKGKSKKDYVLNFEVKDGTKFSLFNIVAI